MNHLGFIWYIGEDWIKNCILRINGSIKLGKE